jgi:hypothetical protein
MGREGVGGVMSVDDENTLFTNMGSLRMAYHHNSSVIHNVSETGSISILKWVGGDTYSVGSLRKIDPNHWTTHVLREPTE